MPIVLTCPRLIAWSKRPADAPRPLIVSFEHRSRHPRSFVAQFGEMSTFPPRVARVAGVRGAFMRARRAVAAGHVRRVVVWQAGRDQRNTELGEPRAKSPRDLWGWFRLCGTVPRRGGCSQLFYADSEFTTYDLYLARRVADGDVLPASELMCLPGLADPVYASAVLPGV